MLIFYTFFQYNKSNNEKGAWHKLSYYRITLFSHSFLSLSEKKEYIDALFPVQKTFQKTKNQNQGFLTKFTHSIGFKPVSSWIDNTGTYIREEVESPEEYLHPKELLQECMQTPIEGTIILSFELPKQKIKHPTSRFSYHTKEIAVKWTAFLKKVFPHLQCELKVIEDKSILSLKEYTLQYFYRNIDKTYSYTLEFNSKTYLTNEEKNEILTYLQPLSDDYLLDIGQYNCSTCAGHSNGQKPIHIELVYHEKNRYAI
jgi:hypothetical protein